MCVLAGIDWCELIIYEMLIGRMDGWEEKRHGEGSLYDGEISAAYMGFTTMWNLLLGLLVLFSVHDCVYA